MMHRRCSKWLWVLLVFLLVWVWGCEGEGTPADSTGGGAGFDEGAFWESLPQPDDAEGVAVGEGFDVGFTTGMIEPEVFDFYTTWLREQGWRQQAPTEAMVTLPHQVWRKSRAELLIEIRGVDELGRSIVWLQLEEEQAE
jgi:hypothetical protein